ncbi:MAG: response regulator transcription factor [Polyangia bacterium]|jgi:two-component system phosphate regulon response regulator PhoB|nr:response regulator transcription factor [Polyangia bacterium]
MAKADLLVVDDEDEILELIRYNLEKEGYAVRCARSGEEAVEEARRHLPDLLLLDLMLPGLDGFDVCRILRAEPKTAAVPIVMITARGEDADIVAGLEVGADDYLTKPFSPRVLVARVKAMLRRRRPPPELPGGEVLSFPGLTIDDARREVLLEGEPVELTATQYALLRFLAERPGWVFTRGQIIDAVKGEDYPVTDRSVDVQVVGLRKKLGAAGELIETVRGVGYRFRK